jgi:hypothetical protein
MREILRASFGHVPAYQTLAKETLAIFNQDLKSLFCNAHNIKQLSKTGAEIKYILNNYPCLRH